MIQKNQRFLNFFNATADAVIFFLSYLLATYIRFDVMYGDAPALSNVWNFTYFLSAAGYSLFMVFVFACAHLYVSYRTKRLIEEVGTVIAVNALGLVLLMAFLYFTRPTDFSRIALIMFYGFSTFFLILKRFVLRRVLRHFRSLGYNQKHVLIVGNGNLAVEYVKGVNENPDLGFKIDGYLSRTQKAELGKCLGEFEDIGKLLDGPGIDEVVVALEAHETKYMPMIVEACEKGGTKISVIPFYNDYIPTHPTLDTIGSTKLINLRTTPLDNLGNAFLKRACDILGSLVLIILSSPFMLFAAVGTKISSPGPILFKQQRVGKDKKLFTMLKFRSMRVNAASDTAWSKNEDPRKTKFGSLIRKTSIDELPQFFNVLKGDMSLIGPRPEIPHYVEQFKETIPLYMVKHQVRPGITGWAQVNGLRGDTSIEKRLKYDIWYIENWSLLLDIKILFKTVFGGMINKEKVVKSK